MSSGFEVTLNGAPHHLAPGTTVDDLVTYLRGQARGVAVAINEAVVPRSRWADTELRTRDRIEVLVPTQGG